MELVCLGLSHQSASVAVREAFAVQPARLDAVLAGLRALPAVAESVALSTCNRTEYYAAGPDSAALLEALSRFVLRSAELPHPAAALPKAFYALEGERAMAHLFRVAGGLESMVLGETEILGQVKQAYAAAAAAGNTARALNKWFQRALRAGKEVRANTGITRGAVSVGSVAVELAERIFGSLEHCQAMILGAGEISELTARALLSRGVRSLIVSNRTFERAAALAQAIGGEALRFEEAEERWAQADILISSTAAPHYVVTREKLASVLARRQGRPLFVIDLAVPRDVEPSVAALDGVTLYDIDSLETTARLGMASRQKEVARAEALLARHVAALRTELCAAAPCASCATASGITE